MSKSFFQVTVAGSTSPVTRRVVAAPSGDSSALQVAVEAAVADVGGGAELVSANNLGNRPIDSEIGAATPPTVDDSPKSVYMVQFQADPNVNTDPLLVMSNARTTSGAVESAASLAITKAASVRTDAVPNTITLVGKVDLEA